MTEEDESAVEEELDALIAAAVQKQLPDAPTAAENPEVELPDVPETVLGMLSLSCRDVLQHIVHSSFVLRA